MYIVLPIIRYYFIILSITFQVFRRIFLEISIFLYYFNTNITNKIEQMTFLQTVSEKYCLYKKSKILQPIDNLLEKMHFFSIFFAKSHNILINFIERHQSLSLCEKEKIALFVPLRDNHVAFIAYGE